MIVRRTPEWHAERRKGIGGSDAARIMRGEWWELWQEKTQRREPKSALKPWDAALRHHVEPLILDWYEETCAHPVTRRGEIVVHPTIPFMRCELDGWIDLEQRPLDAKFLSQWTPGDPMAWALERYTWQIIHQAIVTGVREGVLGVCAACKEPEYRVIEATDFDVAVLLEKEAEFWRYVERDEPPPDAPVVVPPTPRERWRKVDMSPSNAWSEHAALWRANQGPAKAFEQAARELKALVEGDVGEAYGRGVTVKRNKAGSLTIKEA